MGLFLPLLPGYLFLSYLLHWRFLLSGVWWIRWGNWFGGSCMTQFTGEREQDRSNCVWKTHNNAVGLCCIKFVGRLHHCLSAVSITSSNRQIPKLWEEHKSPVLTILPYTFTIFINDWTVHFSCKEKFRIRTYHIKPLGQTWCI